MTHTVKSMHSKDRMEKILSMQSFPALPAILKVYSTENAVGDVSKYPEIWL